MSSRKFLSNWRVGTAVATVALAIGHGSAFADVNPDKNGHRGIDVEKQTPGIADAPLELPNKPYDFCSVEAVKANFDEMLRVTTARVKQARKEGRPPQNSPEAIANIVKQGTDDGSINDTPPIVDEYLDAKKRGDSTAQQDLLKKMTPLEQARAAQEQHDWTLAINILTPMADAGDAEAQTWLASLYSMAGKAWIKMGEQARASLPKTLPPKVLALLCQTNCIPPENEALALKYDRLAAAQGNADAQEGLAIAYACGQGTDKDNIRAYAWFSLELAERAVTIQTNWAPADILQRRDFIAGQMSPEQIQQAKRLLIKCYKSSYRECD